MSWLKDFQGGGQEPAPYRDTGGDLNEPQVQDPHIPDRMVRAKPANLPFLAYKQYTDKQAELHKAWLERKEERDAKIARGEKDVGPEERDPTAEVEVGLLGILKFLVFLLIFGALAGKFVTGSYTWNYNTKWTQLKTYWPSEQRLFSEQMLARFDGSDPDKPVYLAIDGDVYDVSSGKAYLPGGPYHTMAGVDAARSFATGCFKTHRTHDIRGLSESELRGLDHWKKFFAEHKTYFKVGRVSHPPIDPASPIPEHCNPKKRSPEGAMKDTDEAARHPPSKGGDPHKHHGEL